MAACNSDKSNKVNFETEIQELPETVIGKEGLTKKILQKGNSWKTPLPGDEIQVHYSVKLEDGEIFDSSHDKGKPFEFKLGQGEVIKGWDEGIATMKRSERAIFIIPPNLAYGETGSPPLIPPNSTLVFDIELVSWNSVRDITGDGGILKKIIKEGEGWATPKDVDEALVKYVASSADGKTLSRSDDGVEFSLLDDYLCPAMKKSVKTMRKGEIAELTVKPTYCFDGVENGMQPNLNLNIHLELISWKTVVDVTGDKKVLKKLIKVGEGYDRPNEGSLVKVVYIGKLQDGTVFDRKGSDDEPLEYACLEGKFSESLDRAIMTMRKGEEAIVTISSDYCQVEEVSTADFVVYEIKLVDFNKEKPFWKMDTKEKIEACDKTKNEGNVLFKDGKFQCASRKYDKALKFIQFDHSFNDNEKCQSNTLRFSCYLNNAACKLKIADHQEASKLCSKVIEYDPCNVKALFRRAQAYLRINELEKAEIDIRKALKLDPNNSRDVKLVYKELKAKQKQYTQHEVEIFSTMLSRLA
ncbi:70 kDa peptidyl-prolyl isomerase isoform X5 [Nicotiana tabacum]|uniref:peptidylprolyl isomerase n=3 Tax=Nicotiana TaxID=4085 RepID=A0A1S4DDL9_TOBAC|nr:PREDICTED: 70 kDa peptidyl-prolyl isomerase-like isoform X4 [Nicotiana sylvestris]XP_016511540.1 PREDICTED: 70 kDa peptidyl-prolyl isomerase-like isoform X4 [Nicotiana tabacum]